jgi:hypothetical protein
MTQRRRWTAVFAVLLAYVVVALGASPASALERGATFQASRAHADFYIDAFTTSGVSGRIEYFSSFPFATLLSVYVLQCDGFGHGCVTIAANMTQVLGATSVKTSAKPYSPGHVWKTCGSVTDTDGWRLINACTPFTT